MARSIKCPHCGQVMKVGEQAAGKRVDCPACKKAFLAPKALATPAMPPAAPPSRVWYVNIEGRNDGPHTPETVLEQLKTGKIEAQTLAWRKGMADWQPLGELEEFKGAFAAPPPVARHLGRKPHERAADHEPRPHYSRTRSRLDVMLGFWVAGGLAVAALIAVFIILSHRDDRPAPPPKFTQPPAVAPVPPPPTSATPPGVTVIHGPREADQPAKKATKAEVPNAKLLTALAADLDKGFKAAIVAHTRANSGPIRNLSRALKSHADKLAGRDWRPFKDDVESLIKRLNAASEDISATLKERSAAWGLGEGLDDKKRAEILELHKFEWLTNWKKDLDEDLARLRRKGMDF